MQHVIEAFVAAGLFDGNEVVRLLDNTQQRTIPRRQRAEAAGIYVCEIVTNRTFTDLLLYFMQSFNQALNIDVRCSQNVKSETLRGLLSDARQKISECSV